MLLNQKKFSLILIVLCCICFIAAGKKKKKANYNESLVPKYILPDPLLFLDGSKVPDARSWMERRRPEILKLFEDHVYGRAPAKPGKTLFKAVSLDKDALGGTALRKEVIVYLTGKKSGPAMNVLIYLPKKQPGPVPVFLGLNFFGNQTIHSDINITITKEWVPNYKKLGITGNRATTALRGVRANRWPVERILERGYGLPGLYCGDIDTDYHDSVTNNIHLNYYKQGHTKPL